jgi:hypothetical protein
MHLLLYSTLQGVLFLDFHEASLSLMLLVATVIIYYPVKLCKVLKFVS